MRVLAFACVVVASVSLSGISMASAPFKRLTCRGLMDDKVEVVRDGETLVLKWTTDSSSTPHPLVRAVASPEISDTLLASYASVETEIAFPLKDCAFEKAAGVFQCETNGAVNFAIKAYGNSLERPFDTYEGTFASVKFGSKFYEWRQMHSYGLVIDGVVGGKEVLAATSAFRAEDHTSEGRDFGPECKADRTPIYAVDE